MLKSRVWWSFLFADHNNLMTMQLSKACSEHQSSLILFKCLCLVQSAPVCLLMHCFLLQLCVSRLRNHAKNTFAQLCRSVASDFCAANLKNVLCATDDTSSESVKISTDILIVHCILTDYLDYRQHTISKMPCIFDSQGLLFRGRKIFRAIESSRLSFQT